MTDDSGTPYRLVPIVPGTTTPQFGVPVDDEVEVNGTIGVVGLPVRNSLSGGRSGLVAIDITTTTGIRVESTGRGGRATVELGAVTTTNTNGRPIVESAGGILSQPAAAGTIPVNMVFTGTAPVDVFMVEGLNVSEISNTTPGEILNVSADDVGSIIGFNLGIGKSSTGALVNPLNVNPSFGTAPVDIYPFLDQTFGIGVASGNATGGSILSLRARGAVAKHAQRVRRHCRADPEPSRSRSDAAERLRYPQRADRRGDRA
jgi:hypothetical protein